MAKPLTKPQLLAKIEQLETELNLRDEQCAQLQREVDAYLVRQRPSRYINRNPYRDTEPAAPRQRTFKERLAWAAEAARTLGHAVKVPAH